jgi:hypothetical protein
MVSTSQTSHTNLLLVSTCATVWLIVILIGLIQTQDSKHRMISCSNVRTIPGNTMIGRAHVMARTIIKMLVNESHLELSVLCLMVRDDKVLLDATGADHILPLYNEKSSCSTVTTITNT